VNTNTKISKLKPESHTKKGAAVEQRLFEVIQNIPVSV
jgi:hypothetical protein